MFELKNNTNKALKIINVTEARANFATILSDIQSHFIITKNNKPQRVIIDFEEYRQFQAMLNKKEPFENQMLKENVQNSASSSSILRVNTKELDESVASQDSEKSYPLQGLLKNQIELAQNKAVAKTEVKKDFDLSQVEDVSESLESNEAAEEEIWEISDTLEDTILIDEEEDAQQTLEEDLPAPEEAIELLAEEEDYFQSASYEDETQEEFEKILPEPMEMANEAEDLEETLAIEEASAAEEIITVESDKVVEPTQAETIHRTPEEQDYYNRFKKLYENRMRENDLSLSNEWESVVVKKSPIEKKIITENKVETKPVEKEKTEDKILVTPKIENIPAPQQKTVKQEFTKPKEANTQRVLENQSAMESQLPSLQELLKELDTEQNSDGKDLLDTNEIDEIINRITSD